jgi:hypothetical protein
MPPVRWTSEELNAIGSIQPFLIKARVLKKAWNILDGLRDALKSEVNGRSFIAPEGLDVTKGQIAKGERFHDLPFVFLDFPRFFLPGQACTYRTFFWWGNGVVFALIVQGPHLETYKNWLHDNYTRLVEYDLHLSVATTPWEWRKGRGYTLSLTRPNRARFLRALHQRDFIKLERFLMLDSQAFIKNQIIQEGVETFRLLRPMISR